MPEEKQNYPVELVKTLEKVVGTLAFWHFPHMPYFIRERGQVVDVIGWQISDYDPNLYSLYFGVWVSEFEDSLQGSPDLTCDIHHMPLKHDLSLACSSVPTYWWSEAQTADFQQYATLEQLVNMVALPYFETFASIGDVAEMVYYDQRFHNTPMEGRLLENPASNFFSFDIEAAADTVDTALKPLVKLQPPFHFSGGYYWRHRADVMDVIVPKYFANWRFVQIKVTVWHPFLDGLDQMPQTLPQGFTQAIWQSFTEQGKDASYLPPAFLGQTKMPHVSLALALEGLRSYGLPWLEAINTKADAYYAMRPEFRKFYPVLD